MTQPRTSAARRPGGSASSRPSLPRRGGWPVRERSLLRPVLGIPPIAALCIAAGATALGVVVDLLRIGTVGRIFEIAYVFGCVLAVSWVRRRGIFLPTVQPPLLLAVVVPLVAVLIGAPSSAGATQSLLLAGAPLINAFPAMALTTGLVLLVSGLRVWRQRLGPDDVVGRLLARLGRDPGGRNPDGPRSDSSAERRRPASGSGTSGGARGSAGSGRPSRGPGDGRTTARGSGAPPTGRPRSGESAAPGSDVAGRGDPGRAPGRSGPRPPVPGDPGDRRRGPGPGEGRAPRADPPAAGRASGRSSSNRDAAGEDARKRAPGTGGAGPRPTRGNPSDRTRRRSE